MQFLVKFRMSLLKEKYQTNLLEALLRLTDLGCLGLANQ